MSKSVLLILFFWSASLHAQEMDLDRSVKYFDSLRVEAKQLIQTGDVDANYYKQILESAKEQLGEDHPIVVSILLDLADTYMQNGESRNAEPLYRKAKEIRRSTLGKDHPDYAQTLFDLAGAYNKMSYYEDAEELYIRASEIWAANYGKEHYQYASAINACANLYVNMGRYGEAEKFYIESKKIRFHLFGREHTDYAWSVNNLGVLYKRMGKFIDAEILLKEGIDIRKKIFGKDHILFAVSEINLANLYFVMGRFPESEELYNTAISQLQSQLGESHPYATACQNNLAQLYKETGRYEDAEQLFSKSRSIWLEKLGRNHPQYALSLSNLGELYMVSGRDEEALKLFKESAEIRERILGKDHPDYGSSQNSLAQLYWKMGQMDAVAEPLKEVALIQKELVAQAAKHLTEQEQVGYAERFVDILDHLYSYIQQEYSGSRTLLTTGMDLALFHKGFVLQSANQLRKNLRTNPGAVTLSGPLLGIHRALAREYAKPIDERVDVEALKQEADQLEKQLINTVSGLDDLHRDVKWSDVAKQLEQQEAVIEFVNYHYFHPETTDSVMYAAWILFSDAKEPLFIPLFEEGELDKQISKGTQRQLDYVNHIYRYEDRGLQPQDVESRSLFELIWRPILQVLDSTHSIQTIYLSSSGVLHRLNLAAIPIDLKHIMSDRYQIVIMNSTRQLVSERRYSIRDQPNTALLLGGLNYQMNQQTINLEESEDLTSRSGGSINGEITNWKYLPWTLEEVNQVNGTFQEAGISSTLLTGMEGLEETFKSFGEFASESPSVIHLATHGFFFEEDRASVDHTGQNVFTWSQNPMIRSGLILSGGNQRWIGLDSMLNEEDGILTAYEISQLDLSNTELVVLSACETGLGDIKGNEGVYGLQRAFKIAGVKYLIMSLWQVPDRETMQFMTTFYGHWLAEKRTIPEAFQLTQREMRDRFYNPYSWAGFVLVE